MSTRFSYGQQPADAIAKLNLMDDDVQAAIAVGATVASIYDQFDDRYLGSKASAPTLDNDGNALIEGAMYWDSVAKAMFAWNGSAWSALVAASASSVVNTPAGNIASTTVQAALNELDSEKQATAAKDASGGFPGLTLFKLNLRNAANTITSWFTTAATVARTWTMPDKDGTVAMLGDFAAPPAIGTTTPAAGSFTALSATGNSTIGTANANSSVSVRSSVVMGGAGYSEILFATLDANSRGYLSYSHSAETLSLGALSSTRATISSTGLAVTGALSATGNSTIGTTTDNGVDKLQVQGSLRTSAGFGCNGKTAQTSYAVNAAATDAASTQVLVNQLRAALIAIGITI